MGVLPRGVRKVSNEEQMLQNLKMIVMNILSFLLLLYAILMLSKIFISNKNISTHRNSLTQNTTEHQNHRTNIQTEAEIFTHIYDKNIWGGGSGVGSDPKNAQPYLKFLQEYINHLPISSIFDLGCGDWRLMSTLSIPDSITYEGFDLVSTVVDANIKMHTKRNVNFHVIRNIKDFQDQHGDFLIVKDVIQHWPNDSIQFFLKNILPNFKYALITNGFSSLQPNSDIKLGKYRPIDLQKSPFIVGNEFDVVLDYGSSETLKRVYFYTNPAPRLL